MTAVLRNSRACRITSGSVLALALLLPAPLLPGSLARPATVPEISYRNWGDVTEPVYGSSEAGVYAGAELFAGPARFDHSYFHGVLPNGRIVRPAGISVQVGMNPLGLALTPDGKYLITSNDDERNPGAVSLRNPENVGGYSLSVVNTASMRVVSQIDSGPVFIGLQATGVGPYTVLASGGPSNSIRLFHVSKQGIISPGAPASVPISPILPRNAGYVSNYTPGAAFDRADTRGNKPPVPTGFQRIKGAHITFPAGSALSPDGRYLYVACNGDNSLAVVDTRSRRVVKQIPVGYFPYGVAVSADGRRVAVSNWGVTAYRFRSPTYDHETGDLNGLTAVGSNQPDGFYVPVTSSGSPNPRSSSVSLLQAPGGNAAHAQFVRSVSEGKPLDALVQVGGTHPSAMAVVRRPGHELLYIARANDDSLGVLSLANGSPLGQVELSPVRITLPGGVHLHGSYPDALAASSDGRRLYVADAGLNAVAVLDTTNLAHPKLMGRIPTGWYPTGLAISRDGRFLYITNAKGIGEDLNPKTKAKAAANSVAASTGVESFKNSNFIFGTVQKVDLSKVNLNNRTVLSNNFAVHPAADTSIVPVGGHPSPKIKYVFFILHENKTFDSMLGSLPGHFGPYSSLTFSNPDGTSFHSRQYTGVARNTQLLATTFAAAVNYYSDSEESDAGHQFCSSGTASDYTEKTLLVKEGRGLLVNKNFEPEDYPENGYIFNNAARHGVSFKDYGDMLRIAGTDTGTSKPTTVNDPASGTAGSPTLQGDDLTKPLVNTGDVTSPTSGLGQSYFLALPVLAVLGGVNRNGAARLDRNYPGYNFNVSDQRRAQEFCRDFDRMVARGTLPQFLYIYQPNDHTGSIQASNRARARSSPLQQIADGDVALGMVVQHIMNSRVYYDAATGDGSAIFITYDDAQSGRDHIHPHRTPLTVVSPYAKPGYVAKRHYVTASIVKTEELLLGLPPNNLGDLFATDLRDLFQPHYNGIRASDLAFSRRYSYQPSPEAEKLWTLARRLDTSAPDQDSERLGRLARLCVRADELHSAAARKGTLQTKSYQAAQAALNRQGLTVVREPSRDGDD